MQIKTSFPKSLLYPIVPLYWLLSSVRNILFDLKLLKIHRLNCFVISVGNLSTGGTGKTPMIIFLTKELLKKQLRVGILTRGFGRVSNKTHIICNNNKNKGKAHSPLEVGDEPLLLYNKLINVPIAISKNRVSAGKLILQKYKLDVILLDDGYQHRYIRRDINILLINSLDKKQNHQLLPVGDLRESWSNIKRSDYIILTKTNLLTEKDEYITNKLKNFSNVFISESSNKIANKMNNREFLLKDLEEKGCVLLSGIGDPKSFDITSKKLGLNIKGHLQLRDHFIYNKDNIKRILKYVKKKNAAFILTTEKDMVKLKRLDIKLPIIALELVFIIKDKVKAQNLLSSIVNRVKSETYHMQKQRQQKLT
jgi:tetraacyldisaccharide 4'-kinase